MFVVCSSGATCRRWPVQRRRAQHPLQTERGGNGVDGRRDRPSTTCLQSEYVPSLASGATITRGAYPKQAVTTPLSHSTTRDNQRWVAKSPSFEINARHVLKKWKSAVDTVGLSDVLQTPYEERHSGAKVAQQSWAAGTCQRRVCTPDLSKMSELVSIKGGTGMSREPARQRLVCTIYFSTVRTPLPFVFGGRPCCCRPRCSLLVFSYLS